MNISHAQAVGFNDDVVDLLEKNKAPLKKAGLDVDLFIEILESLQDQVTTANANQEALKVGLRTSTEHYMKLRRHMYLTASGYLDMAIAAVGKGSIQANIFRRLRSRIKRRDLEEKPVSVQLDPVITK